jgi:flagellum-specific peptidoglycan hydrolase FlgJ
MTSDLPFVPEKTMRKPFLFLFTLLLPLWMVAQNPEAYVKKYHKIATAEMQRTGVPASITLAQGILESASGTSKLARRGNNHFGIKITSDWKGRSICRKMVRYRRYKRAEDSFRDHSDFLKNRSRYAFLFTYQRTDYKSWAKGLRKAGYAQDRRYPKKLISLIQRYQLDRYDRT